MNRRSKQDRLYCGECRSTLLGEMIPAGPTVSYTGIVGMHCVKCDSITPIWPRKVQQNALVTLAPQPRVVDRCVLCSISIATQVRRGSGEREMFCGNHTIADKDRWRQEHKGRCFTPDCTRPAKARGRCTPCYTKWWRGNYQANRLAVRAITD